MPEVKLQANQEHQEEQANLAHHREERPQRGIEDPVEEVGKHSSEYRWTENERGGDFAADQRLSQFSEQQAEDAGRADDHDQLNDDEEKDILGVAAGRGHRSFSCARQLGLFEVQGADGWLPPSIGYFVNPLS